MVFQHSEGRDFDLPRLQTLPLALLRGYPYGVSTYSGLGSVVRALISTNINNARATAFCMVLSKMVSSRLHGWKNLSAACSRIALSHVNAHSRNFSRVVGVSTARHMSFSGIPRARFAPPPFSRATPRRWSRSLLVSVLRVRVEIAHSPAPCKTPPPEPRQLPRLTPTARWAGRPAHCGC